MKENKLHQSVIIVVFSTIVLLCFQLVPGMNIAGYELRTLDIISDIRINSSENLKNQEYALDNKNSLFTKYYPYNTYPLSGMEPFYRLLPSKMPSVPKSENSSQNKLILSNYNTSVLNPNTIDATYEGKNLLIDFSSNDRSLDHFYTLLNELKNGSGKVRIAMYGDSFIEGDIFCAEVRDVLQDRYGGNGVGFVPITSQVAQYRNTVFHNFKGFETYTLMQKELKNNRLGIGGYCFTAMEDNKLSYSVARGHQHLDSFKDIHLFYTSPINTEFNYSLNDSETKKMIITGSRYLQQKVLKGVNVPKITFNFPKSDTIKLYGVSFEDSTGIYVDNFGMRGNSGLGLSQITDGMHRQFNNFTDYKLIILQYGLNVVDADTRDVSWYVASMVNIINHLKQSYPTTTFLLLSVSDRSEKKNGELKTMKSIPLLVAAQQEIARKSQIAFFNLFEAMGGENSIVALVDHDPPLANKDYTHLNYQGGKKIAQIFLKSIFNGLENYNDKTKEHYPSDSIFVQHAN